jgi:phosphoglycerate dehydrogenase-like enzyme
MPDKPTVLVAPSGRAMDEIFGEESLSRLWKMADIVWARDEPVPDRVVDECNSVVTTLIVGWDYSYYPLREMPNLRTIIAATGTLPDPQVLDYDYCVTHGIRVLGSAPALGPQVAEFGVGLTLDVCREISKGDAAFRSGGEKYLWAGNISTHTMFGRTVGFIGYGGIARAIHKLLAPWDVTVFAYDPWLSPSYLRGCGTEPVSLEDLLKAAQVIYVVAIPTSENRNLLDRDRLELLTPDSILILLSRAHLVDFDALTELLHQGRFRAAIDVFDPEPVPPDHPIRTTPNTVLSAHRAGSIKGDLQEIGKMVVNDLELLIAGLPPNELQVAQPETIKRRGSISALK